VCVDGLELWSTNAQSITGKEALNHCVLGREHVDFLEESMQCTCILKVGLSKNSKMRRL
jgi:hypothetical protein